MGLCYLTGETRKREINAYPMTELERKEMKVPHIVKACPVDVTLEAGKEYEYCTCGLSKTQPFCDGSHKGTPFLPLKFTSEQQKRCFLCLCKKTRSPPYCDNSHKKKRDLDF